MDALDCDPTNVLSVIHLKEIQDHCKKYSSAICAK